MGYGTVIDTKVCTILINWRYVYLSTKFHILQTRIRWYSTISQTFDVFSHAGQNSKNTLILLSKKILYLWFAYLILSKSFQTSTAIKKNY